MEYARLETAKLRDIDDAYYYGAQCRGCGHGARLSVTKLIARLGDDYPLVKVRERLRCERCGAFSDRTANSCSWSMGLRRRKEHADGNID